MSLGRVKITWFVSISFCGNAELGLVRFRLKKRLVRLRKREFFGFIYLVLNTMNTAEKCPKVKFKRNTIFPFKFLFCKNAELGLVRYQKTLGWGKEKKMVWLKISGFVTTKTAEKVLLKNYNSLVCRQNTPLSYKDPTVWA